MNLYHKKYYQDNKDKIKEYSKKYYQDNKDKIKEYYKTKYIKGKNGNIQTNSNTSGNIQSQ